MDGICIAKIKRLSVPKSPIFAKQYETCNACVGADALHRPEKGYEFATNLRKIGSFCRDDVGVVPYKHTGRSSVKMGKNVF